MVLPGLDLSSSNTEIRYTIKLTLGAKLNQMGIYSKFGAKKSHHPTVVKMQNQFKSEVSTVQSDSSKEEDHKHAIAVGKRGREKGTAVQAP